MKSSVSLSLASTGFTIVALALILLIPLCSIRSDPNHLSTLQFATIDASETKVTVNDNEYVGLPDPYDFSKHKQIYQMYLLNYCSGYKRPGTGIIVIDFCSKNGKELWDILPSWTMWGVSVRPDGPATFEWLRQGPNWLYIVYLVAIIMLGLNTLGTFGMLHTWRRGKWVIFAVSATTSCALLVAAIACQVTYGALVARADDDDISITARMGKSVYAVNWLAAVCSICASILSFIHCRRGPSVEEGKAKSRIATFGSDSSSYEYESVKLGTELRVTSVSHSRNASTERLQARHSTDDLIAEGRGRAAEGPYDPFLSPRGSANLRVMSASQPRSPSRERSDQGKDYYA